MVRPAASLASVGAQQGRGGTNSGRDVIKGRWKRAVAAAALAAVTTLFLLPGVAPAQEPADATAAEAAPRPMPMPMPMPGDGITLPTDDLPTDALAPAAQAASGSCASWSGQGSLQDLVRMETCVELQPGTWVLTRYLVIPDGHTLRGNPAAASEDIVLRAGKGWNGNGNEGVVNGAQPPHRAQATVRHFTIDANYTSTGGVGAANLVVDDMVVRGARCWGVAIVGSDMEVTGSAIRFNGHDRTCPSPPGAGIYVAANHAAVGNYAPFIHGNDIGGNVGPGVDIYNVWGGDFQYNHVHDNSGWAGFSLLGAYWTVTGNTITHPLLDHGQPWIPSCATGPAGAHSAAILLCRDTIYGGAVTAANQVNRNLLSSWYGVLLIGNDEANQWAVPATNVISANTIVATVLPCADDSEPVGARANAWAGCTPTYY